MAIAAAMRMNAEGKSSNFWSFKCELKWLFLNSYKDGGIPFINV